MPKKKISRARELRKRKRLIESLPDLEKILRGSVVERYRRCGRRNCHCAEEGDPGHGPAYYLIVTVAPGKTVQVYVAKEQRDEVEAWVENFKQARSILEEVSLVNRRLLRERKLLDSD
jgi:hypothetical protein